jgi:hypothetical protein
VFPHVESCTFDEGLVAVIEFGAQGAMPRGAPDCGSAGVDKARIIAEERRSRFM